MSLVTDSTGQITFDPTKFSHVYGYDASGNATSDLVVVNGVTLVKRSKSIGSGQYQAGPYVIDGDMAEFNKHAQIAGLFNAPASASLNAQAPLNWFWAAVNAMSGGTPAKLVTFGDSNTVGQGSGDSGAALLTNARPYSYTQQLVNLFNAAGIYTTSDSFFGDQNIGVTSGSAGISLYDPRISIGSGWSSTNVANTFGGAFYQATGVTAGALGFTPSVNAWNQADVYYTQVSGGATQITAYQNGTSIGTFNCSAGATTLQKATFTGTLQTGQLTLKVTAGTGGAIVMGAVTRNTAKPSLEVYQGGWGGGVIANLADNSTPYGPIPMLGLLAPNLTILQATVNDVTNGNTQATYQAGLTPIVQKATATGPIIMTVGFPGNVTGTTGGPAYAPLLDSYKLAMRNTELANNPSMIVDMRSIFGNTWASANSKGYVFDSYHPDRAAYALEAQLYYNTIMAARG